MFTLIAVAGYASFGRHPELISRFPGAVQFYPLSFAFFAQGHIIIAAGALIAYLAGRARWAWLGVFAAVYMLSLFSETGGTRDQNGYSGSIDRRGERRRKRRAS